MITIHLAVATASLIVPGVRADGPGCPGSIQWDAGAGTTAWTTITNWSSNTMPAATDDVCIPELATGVEVVHSTGTHSVHSLAGAGGLQVSGGTLSFSAASPGLGQLTVSGGTLSGTGNLPISGAFAWSAGSMSGAGTTSVRNGTISSFALKNLGGGRVLETSGTTTWFAPGELRLNGGASILADGEWTMGDAPMTTPDGTGSLLIPSGATFKKAGAGTGTLAVPLTIAGTLDVVSGTLILSGGGSTTGTIQAATRTLEFAGGAYAMLEGSSLSLGAVVVIGGSLTVDGAYSATSSTFSAGTTSFRSAAVVSGAGDLTVSGAAVVDISSGARVDITRLSITGGTLQGSDRIIVDGSLSNSFWTGGEMRGPGFTWLNSSFLNVDGSSSKDLTGGRGLSTDDTVTWRGTGPIRVGDGAYITSRANWYLLSDASIVDLGGAGRFFSAYGEFRKGGGTGKSIVGIPFLLSSGMVRASTATLEFTASYTQTGGTTQLDGGTLAATAPLDIQGGTLKGNGSVAASVSSSGTVAPGLTAGILSIGGSYSQASGGKLLAEIGGTTPGSQHDRLDVTGVASLSGTLDVDLIGGFIPGNGQTFTVLTSPAITGAFHTLQLPALPAGLAWSLMLNPTSLVLAVSGDGDGDGVGDTGDCAPDDPGAGYLPIEVAGAVFPADKQTFAWTPQAAYAGPATVYDVVRGSTADLPPGGAGETCLASGVATAQTLDAAEPDPGVSFSYRVRARNVCGAGTYGSATGGAPRTPVACP